MRSATIFNFLIEATLMGSVLILIVLLLRHFGRGRLGNRLIYFAWLLVALRLLVPIALPNPVMNELRPTLSDNLGVRPMADQVRVRLMDAMTDTAEAVGGGSVWGNSVSSAIFDFSCETSYGHTARWILLGYGVVGGLVIAAMTWQNVRFRRMLRRRRIERLSGQRLETYRALCEERHVKPLPVWLVDPLPSACLVGVFRPFIALPLSLTDAAFAQAVRHELCHHRAHDEAWGLLRNLCCAAHWFNPLVWLAAALSRIDAEMACDDRVTRGMSENARLAYANALVTCAARKNVPGLNVLATGMTMKGKSLKLRVNAILHSRKVRRGALIAFGTVATAALLAAFATAEWITPIPLPDPPVAAAEGAPYLTRETRIADQEGALTFARDFLASEWIGLAPDELSLLLDSGENQTRWYLEAYDLTKALPIALDFDLYGCVYSYIDSSVYLDEAAPSPQALTEEEKQSVVSFVESFIRSRLPGVYGAYDAIEVYADETTADGRFLTLVTSSARTGELHRFVVQAAPRTRLISFQLLAAESLCFVTSGEAGAMTAFDEAQAIALTKDRLFAVTDFTPQQVESAAFTAEYHESEEVWEVRMRVAAEALSGDALSEAREREGNVPVFTRTFLYDDRGNLLDYKDYATYLSRFETIIDQERANAIANSVAAQVYGVSPMRVTEGYCDFIEWDGEYDAYREVLDQSGELMGRAAFKIDAHTGTVSQVKKYLTGSDVAWVTLAPDGGAVTPLTLITPKPPEGATPTPLPTPEPTFDMGVVYGTPAPDELTEERAIALAREAVREQCGLTQAFVDSLAVYSAEYIIDERYWPQADTYNDGPNWVICFSLGDPRSPFDYSVRLNVKTGAVIQVLNPSTISNG